LKLARNQIRKLYGSKISVLQVTGNLAEALDYLKLPNEERVLCIDAVCINQQDLIDKGQKVGRTARIYQSATRVVVWLGG
jgi:hypothetical protein